jgi:hypothetical protein
MCVSLTYALVFTARRAIADTKLGGGDVPALSAMIAKNKTLRVLNLGMNGTANRVAKNTFDDACVAELAGAIKRNTTLIWLNLCINRA